MNTEVIMPVHEWSVMFTDWLLAVLCIVLAGRLRSRTPAQRRSPRIVARSFDICAAAALIGGLRHGLGPSLVPSLYRTIWYVSYVLIIIAGTLLLWGVVRSVVRSSEHRLVYRIWCSFKCGLACLFLLAGGNTLWVAVSWGADTIVIGLMALYIAQQWSSRPIGRWLIAGTIISVVAGLVQTGRLIDSSSGTLHNDLFHLLEMPAIWCYYRAAMLFRETPDAATDHRFNRWTRAIRRPWRGSDPAA